MYYSIAMHTIHDAMHDVIYNAIHDAIHNAVDVLYTMQFNT